MSSNPHTVPKEGFIGTGVKAGNYNAQTSTFHNVAELTDFVLGQKIRYYNATVGGWGTCVYLQYSAGAETLAAGSPVGLDEANDNQYQVTGDQSTIGDSTPTAIALSAMTTAYYGWFWCGGTCPDFSTDGTTDFSAVTVTTDNSVVAGKSVEMPLSTTDNIIVVGTTSALISKIGYALADDGGTTTDMANLILSDNWS